MKVFVFTTGGTIGSAFDGRAINVCSDGRCAVAERYASEHPDEQFDIHSPLNILSERISADNLNRLSRALYAVDLMAYNGVILTVGSDNLAYLSSFVGLLFGDITVPVCLVAADKVLSDERSNGYANFCCAVELIRQKKRGVFVPYRNSDGVMTVHSATDLRQADLSDDFLSFHGAYAVYENGVFKQQRALIKQTIPPVFGTENPPRIADNVLLLHPYPLQDYTAISAHGKKAVLHTLYHSGTLDAANAVRFTKEQDVPFYLASFRSGRPLYATAAELIEAGAVPLFDISPECAYMKLLLACAQDEMSVREFMV